jgi:ADP-ribosylglycohydrolase
MAYKDWLATQSNQVRERNICWISHIPELNIPRAPGNTCLEALYGDKEGTIEDRINDSKGCGCVMRVAPVGLFYRPNLAFKKGMDCAAITHGHALGYISAGASSYIISNIISGMDIDHAICETINEVYKYDESMVVSNLLKNLLAM